MSREIFIDTAEAARQFGKPNRAAFRKWAKRRRIAVIKDGRRWLVDRLEVEAALRMKTTVA